MPGINDSKCVLVIGATAGIGRTLALAIHALPTKPTVIVTGRRKERLAELVKKGEEGTGGLLAAIQVDVSAERQTLKEFSEDVVSKFPDVTLSARLSHDMTLTFFPNSLIQLSSPRELSTFSTLQSLTRLTLIVSLISPANGRSSDHLEVAFGEFNINYVAIFSLVKFFLPHFLKLSVGPCIFFTSRLH